MVPLVPKLAVMTPARVLPVPMAPIMLSPPPALTSTPGLKSSSLAVEAWRRAGGLVAAASAAAACRPARDQSRPGRRSDHLRLRTSSSAVPLASPYSMTFSPVSQKFR